jgi:hypothetical protein
VAVRSKNGYKKELGPTDRITPMDMPTAEFALAGCLAELRAKGRLVVHGGHRPILVLCDRGRVFARNRRAVASVTRCELTFRRKLILRTSTTALRWKKGEGLPMQPGQSDDGAETATTREVERDNLVLSGAVEMTVGAKAQSTRPSKLGNV